MVASGVPSSWAAPAAWVATASSCWSRRPSSRRIGAQFFLTAQLFGHARGEKGDHRGGRAKLSHMP
jgi:hypothetical protein